MKKFSLLLVAMFCLTSGIFAQKGIEVGINFTPTSPWILNDEDFAEGANLDFRFNYGFNVGATLGFNLTDNFGLTTGFMYVSGGQRYITAHENIDKANQGLMQRDLRYVRIPVLFKFNGDINSNVSSFFRIGPHFDFLQSAKYKIERLPFIGGEGSTSDFLNDTVLKDFDVYKKNVVGLTLEMGSQFTIVDNLKFILAFQLAGSLTHTEGADAKGFYPYSGNFLNRERGKAWNVSAGITLGLNYTIGF